MGQYRTHVFVCTSREDDDVWYHGAQESDLQEILDSHIIGGTPVERLRYHPGVKGANKTPDAH
jgi:(2Fe-2S) ferredoxin